MLDQRGEAPVTRIKRRSPPRGRSVAGSDPGRRSVPPDSSSDRIEILRLARSLGHQRAIAVGLCELSRRDDIDAVLVMDSDGEDRPGDIAALLKASRIEPAHIVLARRA